ncbi:MAG: hypothetical protein EBS97_07255, partial [Verrucomicrobia bacterium]|nr:hypothetical protein [Verrucomicrobiota bacterium]
MYALLPSAPEPGSGLSPDKRRKKRWLLAALALAGLVLAATVSQWATVKVYSNPPGVLDSTSYVPTGTVVPVSTPPLSANGSRFTGWTVNGVRQVDAIGISMSALSLTITNSVDIVAQYTPETQDLDSDQVP